MGNIKKFWLRFWVVFLFHIVIKSFDLSFPNGPFELNIRSLVFSVFFIVYGLTAWQIGDYMNIYFRRWVNTIERERSRILAHILLHIILGYLLVFSLNYLYRLGDVHLFNKGDLWKNILWFNPELTISLLSMYLIVLGFDSYFQVQKKLQDELLKAKELERENLLAQYRALKAQIEPHFLFNSLSVLSSLVYEDADLSADFIMKMSKTLRYIIEKNEFHLVQLSEELGFLEAYFFLIRTRLETGVILEERLEKSFVENTFLPPVSLQILVENAINHNKYNPDDPLKITIESENDFIVVRNNLNPRMKAESSTQTGLMNLSKRYELVSQKQVIIQKTDDEFIVKLPTLNHSDYERFNI